MIQILDTTLREGEQTPGVYFDTHIKMEIAKKLNELGVDYIEAGHPIVSNEIYDGVKRISNLNLNATIAAHSRSLKKDVDLALECNIGFLGIFYCVSDYRLNGVFKKTLSEAIDTITDVISYAKEKNSSLLIRYTPEDAVRSEFENVVRASVAAVKAGADIISIADTTGYMIPGTRSMKSYIKNFKNALLQESLHPTIEVHCHNDRGLALANSLDAYQAGAEIIDTSVLGLGERAGITDLAELLTILTVDFGHEKWNLKVIDELYKLVSLYSGREIPVNRPIVGANAFTHCAGLHTEAAIRDPTYYLSIDPLLLGRRSEISLDHMSGVASIRYMLKEIGEPDTSIIPEVLSKVKEIGQKGKTVSHDEFKMIVSLCKDNQISRAISNMGE